MILNCNSCEKKFVVPDQAITPLGRVVQCGSCGNKWKQFPIEIDIKKENIEKKTKIKKTTHISKTAKSKKKRVKKNREFDLYSPAYLAKKHGISLNKDVVNPSSNNKVSFGFYNSLILLLIVVITLSKSLHFFQEFIIEKMPFTEFYINYFFESIKNMFEIWKNLISSY
jgi:predicted Zn finger-like uncharacterized protein